MEDMGSASSLPSRLSILSSQQAEADFPCLDLVLGQACVPFLKLEALLCQVCGLERGGGAGHKGLICVFWRAAGTGHAAPAVPCLLERGGVWCPCYVCLPLRSQEQKSLL